MTLITACENIDVQHSAVHLTLSSEEAEDLRIMLPWLLQALTDRPMTPARQPERRCNAHTILERLQTIQSSQLQQAEQRGTRR